MKPPAGKPGTISQLESYTLAEFRQRTKMGRYAFGKARKAGLPVREVGGKLFVRGADWDAFLAGQGATQ